MKYLLLALLLLGCTDKTLPDPEVTQRLLLDLANRVSYLEKMPYLDSLCQDLGRVNYPKLTARTVLLVNGLHNCTVFRPEGGISVQSWRFFDAADLSRAIDDEKAKAYDRLLKEKHP